MPASDTFKASPPLAQPPARNGVDLVAFWYNDFGLRSTVAGNGRYGWVGWYDWRWNQKNGKAIDPSREPLLGWFHGDDPAVLDWQCHWLVTYGITGVALSPSEAASPDHWQDPTDPQHWLYQFMTAAPNCRLLKYILFARAQWGGTPASHAEAWRNTLAIMRQYPGAYTIKRGGRSYPCLYVFEGEALRGVFDKYNGSAATARFLTGVARTLQADGQGGLCLLVRHSTAPSLMNRQELLAKGVLYLDASYSEVTGERPNAKTMTQLTADLSAPGDAIVNVVTSRRSMSHPSNFAITGNSPDAFRRQLDKAIALVRKDPRRPQLVTIYSVWEWAEGGPNLSPTRGDGFAYLQAVKDAVADNKAR